MKEPAKAESPGMRSGLKGGSEVGECCHPSREGSCAQAPHTCHLSSALPVCNRFRDRNMQASWLLSAQPGLRRRWSQKQKCQSRG